uniref:Ubiquitin-like domain-containing protein n=1 Tax=Meloidogyne enterolobii TaxID=390850 RepID=A0A6V7U865_MELEN|nr:unnamed protein product [Meloidogyne enterolobii]
MSQQEKIQLTIRCALQTFSDYNVECFENWTVLQLKEHLTQICDFNPEVERQRLIYAGHCLKNEQTIKDVLKQQRDGMPRSPDEQLEKQVIHMVYTGKVASPTVRHRSAAASSAGSSSSTGHRNSSQIPVNNGTGNPMPMPFPTNNFYPTQQQDQQQAWMNAYQQYISQMMPLYQNAVGMPYGGVQWPMWNPLSQAAFAQQAVFAQFSNAAAFGQQLPPIQQQQQVPLQMPIVANVQQNNEPRAAPDFLDIIYKSIRFILLGMVLLLYSSIERFVFVLAMIGLFWLVNIFRGRQQRAREAAAGEARPGEVNNREAQNGQQQQEEIQNEGNQQPTTEQQQPTPVNNSGNSAWSIFWGTFQAFFTSLIPENQAPLDVN